VAGDQVKAARVYSAYRSAIQNSEEAASGLFVDTIAKLPKWADLPDKAAPWFAVCNAEADFLAPPETAEPFDYKLSVAVEPRRIADEFVDADGRAPATNELVPETLPTSLRIRPIVAGDMCVPEFDAGTAAFNHAMRAKIHGVEFKMLERRLAPADVDAAFYLLNDVTTDDAWSLMRQRFIDEGGTPMLPMQVEVIGWQAAALELFSSQHDDYFLVKCRSPGLGTLKLGPIRVIHTRIYEDVGDELTEWDGRIAALAEATKVPEDKLKQARIEDVVRLWAQFQELKKKQNERALSLFAAQRSMLSTAGGRATSPNSPSPDSK